MLPAESSSEGFLRSIIRSATSDSAQVFTEAVAPFEICQANAAWTQPRGFTVAEALGKTSAETLGELHAGISAQRKTSVRLTNYTNERRHDAIHRSQSQKGNQ